MNRVTSFAAFGGALLTLVFASLYASPVRSMSDEKTAPATQAATLEIATFAGGCFWCMEPPFDALDGVVSTTSGYMGGQVDEPTYEQVSSGGSGHAEVVRIVYNPKRVRYEELLEVFWRNIDPTVYDRQFCDSGSQYRSGIFFHTPEQKKLAAESKRELESSGRFGPKVATEVVAAGTFWPAEDYHQDYYKKNPVRYKYYRYGCGRDKRLEALWDSRPS